MTRRIYILAFVCAAVIGSSAPTRFCAACGNPARPIKGSATGAVVGFVPPNEIVLEATGKASHLGRFTREEHLYLNGDQVSFFGWIAFDAANNDRLLALLEGHFTSPTTAEGWYHFAGGTGRFGNATGTARFIATTDDQGVLHVEFGGTIRY